LHFHHLLRLHPYKNIRPNNFTYFFFVGFLAVAAAAFPDVGSSSAGGVTFSA
jgi:hypothetical protein